MTDFEARVHPERTEMPSTELPARVEAPAETKRSPGERKIAMPGKGMALATRKNDSRPISWNGLP